MRVRTNLILSFVAVLTLTSGCDGDKSADRDSGQVASEDQRNGRAGDSTDAANAVADGGAKSMDEGAGDVSTPDNPDEERLAALAQIIRDTSRPDEERRQALIERAELLGVTVPPSLLNPPEKPPRIEIPLPDGPPTGDAVEPGTYVLSLSLEFENGATVDDRHPCTVQIAADRVEIRLDRATPETSPIVGTLKAGRLRAEGRERSAVFELRGQVVGPSRLAGRIDGEERESGQRITEGRWALERVK